MKITLLFCLFLPLLLAEDKPKDVKPPDIPADLKARFEQARADAAESEALHSNDMAKLQALYADIQKVCGDKFVPRWPQRGVSMTCVPAPTSDPGKK
jgi:hypothetical protein